MTMNNVGGDLFQDAYIVRCDREELEASGIHQGCLHRAPEIQVVIVISTSQPQHNHIYARSVLFLRERVDEVEHPGPVARERAQRVNDPHLAALPSQDSIWTADLTQMSCSIPRCVFYLGDIWCDLC